MTEWQLVLLMAEHPEPTEKRSKMQICLYFFLKQEQDFAAFFAPVSLQKSCRVHAMNNQR